MNCSSSVASFQFLLLRCPMDYRHPLRSSNCRSRLLARRAANGRVVNGVVVEPARPTDELVDSDRDGPPLEGMRNTARSKLRD